MKKSHNIKRPYKCKLCDAEFSNTTSQAVHMRLHTGERPFKCEYCDESFRFSASYRHHKSLQHNIGESHTCEQCSRPYVTKKLLDDHIISTHLKIKTHECKQYVVKCFHC